MKPKCDVAQGKAAPCHPGAADPELVRLAGFAASSGRYFHAHLVLERTEQAVRRVCYLTGDTYAQRQLVALSHDLVTLALREVNATLDADFERAARLRGRYWRTEAEHLRLLTRLNEELDCLLRG